MQHDASEQTYSGAGPVPEGLPAEAPEGETPEEKACRERIEQIKLEVAKQMNADMMNRLSRPWY